MSFVQTPNSALVYSLARQTNNPFAVDPNSGDVILQNSLDFETTTSYDVSTIIIIILCMQSPDSLFSV